MSHAPHAAPVPFDTVDEAVQAVRARGLRLSTPRRLLLEALFDADGPVTAPQLAQELQLDATSVYRNLEVLERHGLIRHIHLGHGAGLWALSGRHELEYLYCERCSEVASVSAEELDPVRDQIRRLFGYQTRFTHHAIIGLCRRCAAGVSIPRAY